MFFVALVLVVLIVSALEPAPGRMPDSRSAGNA
jgi:hypothetical protein